MCNVNYLHIKFSNLLEKSLTSGSSLFNTVITEIRKLFLSIPILSVDFDKTSAPVRFDVDITGCNDLKIMSTHNLSDFWGDYPYINIGELSLYQ